MKHCFPVVLCLCFCAELSAQTINLADSIITCQGVAGIHIGDTISEILSRNPEFTIEREAVYTYGIDGEGLGYTVYSEGEKLFFFCEHYTDTNRIMGMVVLSGRFSLPNGISTGKTIREIKKANKDFWLKRSFYWMESEYYFPDQGKCIKTELNDDVCMVVHFSSSSDHTIGQYLSDDNEDEKTENFRILDAHPSRIIIW